MSRHCSSVLLRCLLNSQYLNLQKMCAVSWNKNSNAFFWLMLSRLHSNESSSGARVIYFMASQGKRIPEYKNLSCSFFIWFGIFIFSFALQTQSNDSKILETATTSTRNVKLIKTQSPGNKMGAINEHGHCTNCRKPVRKIECVLEQRDPEEGSTSLPHSGSHDGPKGSTQAPGPM